ncbi:MAG: GNAT family N-acetyltransferase, partial [Actinomycetota bacterium]|nr:GNAT family N-acetyltransferase [Actinomycetota bacterium]
MPEPQVRLAVGDADWQAVRALIEAYLASLGFDIGFQGLDPELEDPAGSYGPPAGAALLAVRGAG